MNNPLLIFIDAADDAAAYPLSSLLSMTVAADATILMKFKSSLGGGTTNETDLVTVTCTSNTELTVFKAIASAIASPAGVHEGYVVVADGVNSVFVDSNITATAITIDT
jgi:hypothetical protein